MDWHIGDLEYCRMRLKRLQLYAPVGEPATIGIPNHVPACNEEYILHNHAPCEFSVASISPKVLNTTDGLSSLH
jgi:hypothetical protein